MAENYTVETDIIYEGNGTVKEFPITFSFSDENEVVVYLNGEVIRRGYSIDGDSVVFNVAPADGDEIALAKATVDAPEEEENTSGESSESGSDTVYDQASREHIKINPVPTKVKYSGNGEVTEFPTGFAFFENDNIVVYLNGVIINSGYSVTGVGETDGGSVIFEEAPKEGDKIVILRKVAIERVTDFQEGGAFRAKNINDELDRQTAFCQQIQEQIDRCVKVEVTDDQDPQELIDKVFEQLDVATTVGEQAIKTAEETRELVEGSKALIQEETQKAVAELNLASEDYIEKSRIWAEGEQAEVETLGGELSSRGFADFAYAIANTPEDVPLDQSKLIALDIVKGPKGDKGDKGDDGKDGGGLEIGDVAFAVMGIDETKNLRRYLNGQVISQSQFVSFANWVKERAKLYPNTVATEENWQAEVTNSKLGQCGKFVIDDNAGTIRLPKVVNINGLQDLALMGSIKAESLPNITGTVKIISGDRGDATGAFRKTSRINKANTAAGGEYWEETILGVNASRSSSTYKDNAPVQQEAIQYPYFIQVATGVEESVDVTREIELNNPFSLLDYKWSEYEITNASWLLSNGQFNSGATYISVYNLLLEIYNGTVAKEGVSVKLSTESFDDTDFVLNTDDTTFRLPIKVANTPMGGSAPVYTNQTANRMMNIPITSNSANGEAGVDYLGMFAQDSSGNVSTQASHYSDLKPSWVADLSNATNDELKLYFYVGETIQDANVIAASQVLTTVADCVRKSSATDRATVVGWGMPDYSAGISANGVYSSESNAFTAPCDGVLVYQCFVISVGALYVDGIKLATVFGSSQGYGWTFPLVIKLEKNQKLYITGLHSAYNSGTFLPFKGVN